MCALVSTALIFGYTSVYSNQGGSMTDEQRNIVESLSKAIIALAKGEDGSPIHRFMLFPLFLAGVQSTIEEDKQWVLEALTTFLQQGLGQNARLARDALSDIYAVQKQDNGFVDWIDFMKARNCRIIMYDI